METKEQKCKGDVLSDINIGHLSDIDNGHLSDIDNGHLTDIDNGHLTDIIKDNEMSVMSDRPISVRYKMASLQVLENLRKDGNPRLTDVLMDNECLLSDNATEEEIEAFRNFRESLYPALPRLKDLQAKTIEAIHKKTRGSKGENKLEHERIEVLTGLLKAVNHDIETIKGGDEGKIVNNVFIFNDERAKRIAARLTGRDGEVSRYAVAEESH